MILQETLSSSVFEWFLISVFVELFISLSVHILSLSPLLLFCTVNFAVLYNIHIIIYTFTFIYTLER